MLSICEALFLSKNIGKIILNRRGNVGLVHRIDVHICDAVGKEVDDLVGGVSDSCLLHRGRGIAEFIDERLEALRHKRARKFDCTLYLITVGALLTKI